MNASRPVEDVLEETTPLLLAAESQGSGDGVGAKTPTPLPKGQISILMLLGLAEPITALCIYPFINQLITDLDITGGDERKVGYYAGMIESIFFAMEALFVFQWSRLSDHIGRKPVLLVGVAGLFLSMISFGLSKTFWGLVVSRSLVGMLNGNTGVMKSMMAEITDETNISHGFAMLPVAWSAGSTMGPLIGGQLARPHDRWPGVFTHPFWRKYPYFLPCAASAAFSAFTFVITAIFLKETVHKRARRDPATTDDTAPTSSAHDDAPPPLRKVLTRRVVISIANYAVVAVLDIAFFALLPLFLATPIPLGGLGLAPPTIGVIIGTFGLLNGCFQALLFARLMDRYGPKRLFQQGLLAFFPLYALFPVMSLYAKAHGITPVIWALVLLQQMLLVVMDLAFGSIFIFITSSAANNRALGATNGIAQFIASVVRALGPVASTSLFAVSLQRNWLGGYGVYPIMIALALVLFTVSTHLPRNLWPKEKEAESRTD
ncbi:MFS general substrate transporter [Trametes versicolor FP-101664 SS1]|uniref:MFS general substrate transporter n=1 Tax=Trametes versicolor (strain FP-101664) TaxID=717944 RepID=UPI0004622340|nr:MFS general substrate transporter [Trametes versicolor FP-101664 SS1]EIW54332.1 MFS general substrate transporter [Trametes versicolor FP-101664 SS1]